MKLRYILALSILGITPAMIGQLKKGLPAYKKHSSNAGRAAFRKNKSALALPDNAALKEMPAPLVDSRSIPTTPAFNVGFNFLGGTQVDRFGIVGVPINLNGWVGSEQYIFSSYGLIRSFNKATGLPDNILNVDSFAFFSNLPDDVRLNYSRFADHWFLSGEGITLTSEGDYNFSSNLIIAWSNTGVITLDTVWSFHTFSQADYSTVPNPFMDYQQLATDANAVYIAGDVFDQDNSDFYLGSSVVVIPLSSFVAGNPFEYTIFKGLLGPDYPLEIQSEFTVPADNFDPEPQFGYLANVANNNFPEGNIVTFFRISNPGSATPQIGNPVLVTVPTYGDGTFVGNYYGNAPHAGNLGGGPAFLQSGISDFFSAPHVRNHQLYACQVVTLDADGVADAANGDRIGVRWYQFDMTGDATGRGLGTEEIDTVPVLIQTGLLWDSTPLNPLVYFVPTIMTNKNGDLVIGGTVSGSTAYTNVFYADRKATDPAGMLRGPFLLTNNPGNAYNASINESVNAQRWGDETGTSPDPSNDLNIWTSGQWAALVNIVGIQSTQLIPSAS